MKKVIILTVILFSSLAIFAQDDDGSIAKEGDKMPEFSLSSEKHGNIQSKDLKGKVVLINIFATWCGPCQPKLAEVEESLWPKYKDNTDFSMLVVGREHTDGELAKYNEKKKFSFPIYPDPKRDFTSKFASMSIPRTYLVSKEGKIVYAGIGYSKDDISKLMKLIDAELKK